MESTLNTVSKQLGQTMELLEANKYELKRAVEENKRLEHEINNTLEEMRKEREAYLEELNIYKNVANGFPEFKKRLDNIARVENISERKKAEEAELKLLSERYAINTNMDLALVNDFYVRHTSMTVLSKMFKCSVPQIKLRIIKARDTVLKNIDTYGLDLNVKLNIIEAIKHSNMSIKSELEIFNMWLSGMTIPELREIYGTTLIFVNKIIKDRVPEYNASLETQIWGRVTDTLRKLQIKEFNYTTVDILAKLFELPTKHSVHLLNLYLLTLMGE